MSTMCVCLSESRISTKNGRTWNNAVQVANCRSWTVNMTQNWSISWMAKVYTRVSGSPSEGRKYASFTQGNRGYLYMICAYLQQF